MNQRILTVTLIIGMACGLAGGAAAQTPSASDSGTAQAGMAAARVVGIVKDASGAVVRGAKIDIKHLDLDVAHTGVADADGRFGFEGLRAGRYEVSAESPGFERTTLTVVGRPGLESRADLVLEIARQEAVVVVTAAPTSSPLTVVTDPRAPRQPIPAHDGADYLKTIPGFSVIRKGGTDGDPVLRGMAGSRVGILMDGQQVYGGCGGRMDPPTAYVFPAAYDRITVLKGPQSVLGGAGTSAGTVMFERDIKRVDAPGVKLAAAATFGAFGRHDEMADVRAAVPEGYFQAVGTRSHTDDYQDGGGASIHSAYTRWSGSAALGWTPDPNTRLEVSGILSDGEAAYADRAMDGLSFARENVALKFDRRMNGGLVRRVEALGYYNYIDHVMDNYSMRTPGLLYSVTNPDRLTRGGRATATLALGESTSFDVGADAQHNVHRIRNAAGKTSAEAATSAYLAAPRLEDMRFGQLGAFAEGTGILSGASTLKGGVRVDWHEAVDSRMCVTVLSCPANSPLKNDTMGATDRKTLVSAFGRYQHALTRSGSGTFYAGLGHAERFPDYWERLRQDPVTFKSAFLTTRPEKTTQVDTGVLWRAATWSGSVSAFYGKISDYILIRWTPLPTLARNVDATTFGAEADVTGRLTRHLTADVTLAYVRSDNDTDGKPLAQQPPTEARFGLRYDNRAWSFGALARLVAAQDRVDVGSGNIVINGSDIGPTGGFAVFSVNGGYRLNKSLSLTGGVDNLLDRTYAEHLSKGGAMIPGYIQTTRINEPGRTAWVSLNVYFN